MKDADVRFEPRHVYTDFFGLSTVRLFEPTFNAFKIFTKFHLHFIVASIIAYKVLSLAYFTKHEFVINKDTMFVKMLKIIGEGGIKLVPEELHLILFPRTKEHLTHALINET